MPGYIKNVYNCDVTNSPLISTNLKNFHISQLVFFYFELLVFNFQNGKLNSFEAFLQIRGYFVYNLQKVAQKILGRKKT